MILPPDTLLPKYSTQWELLVEAWQDRHSAYRVTPPGWKKHRPGMGGHSRPAGGERYKNILEYIVPKKRVKCK